MNYDQIPPSPLRRGRGFLYGFAILGMVAWSLVIWLAYIMVDPVLGWFAASLPNLMDIGKDAAVAAGGKPAGDILQTLGAEGLFTQIVRLLQLVAKPLLIAIWLMGMAALALLPAGVSLVARLLSKRR
ncbi:MAG: hypothetical protein DI528_11945 [Shinella sp.]|nr:MAG: hypothetical protein DI528_11945 [Shinella sp.]